MTSEKQDAAITLINEVYAMRSLCTQVGHEMNDLARAFRMTGNDQMVDVLMAWADELRSAADRLQAAHAGAQASNVKASQQAAADVLAAFAESVSQ